MADTLADTFLPPIEQPQGLLMKLAYYFTQRQFGKVLTPLKVHSARLPAAFGLFYAKVSKLDEKLELPQELALSEGRYDARSICAFTALRASGVSTSTSAALPASGTSVTASG